MIGDAGTTVWNNDYSTVYLGTWALRFESTVYLGTAGLTLRLRLAEVVCGT